MKKKLLAGLACGVVMLGMAGLASATPIAHWGFDETGGTTAFNSVGTVNGTLVGGVTFTSTGGVAGGAIQITDGFVDMGNNFPASSTFSVQAWVKISPGDIPPEAMVVAKHQSGIGQGYFLSVRPPNEGFYSASGPYDYAVGGPPLDDGLWHQLVGVYNNGVTSIYVDGNLEDTGSAGYSDNSANFMVGGYFDGGGTPVNRFRGLIDEVTIYDDALSENDVKGFYDSTINPSAPVPEPATMLLMGTGLAGLIGTRRKKKQ